MATEILSSDNLLSGREVGNWRLGRTLGVGGFGAVYEAEHLTIPGRRGAVKVLHAQMAQSAEIKRRFINEASAASRAEHENIVQIFDGGVTPEGLCYVVMELLTGQSLAALLREGALPAERASNIAAQVAAALAVAHGLGIVHRDLKPDNIFIVRRDANAEFVKVLDFGIAKLHDGSGKTQTGMWLGTPPYMAPEQWQTLPDIDGRADLYALGVILFECLTGALPFSAATPFEWLTAHLQRPVPELAGAFAGPPELAALVRRLLAKQREERPQTAEEVQRELRRGAQRTPTPVQAMERAALAAPISSLVPPAAASPAPATPTALTLATPPGGPALPTAEPGAVAPPRAGVRPLWLGLSALLLGGALLGYSRLGKLDPVVQAQPARAATRDAGAAETPDLAPVVVPDLCLSAASDLMPIALPDLASARPIVPESRRRATSRRPSQAPPPAPAAIPAPKPDETPTRRKYEPIY